MKTFLYNLISRIRNFVARHKTGIAVLITAILGLILNRLALSQHDKFLKEKGLYDEFYMPTDEEMGTSESE